jgi:hypothetical protein
MLAQSTLASGPSLPALSAATWAGSTAAIVDATTEFTALDNGVQVTGPTVNGDFVQQLQLTQQLLGHHMQMVLTESLLLHLAQLVFTVLQLPQFHLTCVLHTVQQL